MYDTPIPDPDRPTSRRRATINRANALHSTGPRTPEGKARSSKNALCHGLSSRTALLPAEDPAAYQRHSRQFFDEYRPATATETHLTRELADVSWRMNRIPALEADALHRAAHPASEEERIAFDIVDAHRLLTLALSEQRQFALCKVVEHGARWTVLRCGPVKPMRLQSRELAIQIAAPAKQSAEPGIASRQQCPIRGGAAVDRRQMRPILLRR
jgi:hypothetical protein